MSKITTLKSVLHSIAMIQNESFDNNLFDVQLTDIFENNGFVNDARVPDWLVLFFQAILNGQAVPKTAYIYDRITQGDTSNFLAELEDILQLQWRDEGESVELIADKIKTFGVISIEDDTYQVGLINA